MSWMARVLHLDGDAVLFSRIANATRMSMREHLWNGKAFIAKDMRRNRLIETPMQISNIVGALYGSIATTEHVNVMLDSWLQSYCNATTLCLPSLTLSSSAFSQQDYWRGPVWANTNWLVLKVKNLSCVIRSDISPHQAIRKWYASHDRLMQLGKRIYEETIQVIEEKGSYEYFDPITSSPLGSANFSWTSALYLDLKAWGKF